MDNVIASREERLCLLLLKARKMEEKVNEMASNLMTEAYNKPMLFKMYEDDPGHGYTLTASPAALKIFAAQLILASEISLDSEVEIDMSKYVGEQAYPALLSITVAEEEKPVEPVKDNLWAPVGCAVIVISFIVVFFLGLEKLYELFF